MNNNNTVTAIAIILAVLLIGGAVALVLMLGGSSGVDVDPISYVSRDSSVFAQFDMHLNADELLDQIRPLTKMYQSMLDDSMGEMLGFDASFIDLAGFFVANSSNLLDEELVFGIKLSGKGNPELGIDNLLSMISSYTSEDITIEKDDDGYIRVEDELVIYVDDEYILLSPNVGSIQGALAVKDGKRKGVTENPDWEEIESNMTSNEFSFFAQFNEDSVSYPGKSTDKPKLVVVGSAYEVPNERAGVEITLIRGRERIRQVFSGEDEFEEFMSVVDKIFDNQRDPSDILSQLPPSPMKMALPVVPIELEDFMDPNEQLIKGITGIWLTFDEGDYGDPEPEFGMMAKSDTYEPNNLLWEMFNKEEYVLKRVFGGNELYDRYWLENEDGLMYSTPEAYVKDHSEYLIIASSESVLDMIWEPSPIQSMKESAFYMMVDYSSMVENMIEASAEDNPFLSIPMVSEIADKANMVLDVNIFEDSSDIKLIIELSGDFKMLNDLGESLLP